jgi:predicted XRE-type DNA-binding protein
MVTVLPVMPAVAAELRPKTGASSVKVRHLDDEKCAIKEALMGELAQWMAANRLKQFEAAQILGVAPSRVSDAVNKKTVKFTVDALIDLLSKVGKHVQISVH